MGAAGWKEGTHYVIEERWADDQIERLPTLARELIEKKPTVIVGHPQVSIIALAGATSTIPIVQANGGDLVAAGLAKSLARPGGMVTGVTNINVDVSAKHLELLLTAHRQLRRVGFLVDPGSPRVITHLDVAKRGISHYGVDARFAEATHAQEIESAIAKLLKESVEGLVIMASAWFPNEASQIMKFALLNRWPVIGDQSRFAEAGALLSYGANRAALFRRSAYYVDRILKGSKPSDLPIEQPTTFEFVVNLKTAKSLGLTMPPDIMVRATSIIQ
jgi:putative ABC transport system substrate-binding protein